MFALFLELDRIVHFLSSLLAPHGEVAKPLPVMMLAIKKLITSGDAVVGLEPIAKALVEKHMATVLPNCFLVRCLQRLESFVTYITWVTLVCFVPPH